MISPEKIISILMKKTGLSKESRIVLESVWLITYSLQIEILNDFTFPAFAFLGS